MFLLPAPMYSLCHIGPTFIQIRLRISKCEKTTNNVFAAGAVLMWLKYEPGFRATGERLQVYLYINEK